MREDKAMQNIVWKTLFNIEKLGVTPDQYTLIVRKKCCVFPLTFLGDHNRKTLNSEAILKLIFPKWTV